MEYAVERGVNWIDTAAVYGLGHAEEIVGRLLRRVPASRHYQEPRLSRNLELVEVMRRIGQRHGLTPSAVAISWVLRKSAVTGAIVGAHRPA